MQTNKKTYTEAYGFAPCHPHKASAPAEVREKHTIGDYELIDHGIDHCQYFQGCGTSLTKFDNVTTGCGDNFAEALDFALDSIAQNHNFALGYCDEFEARIKSDEGYEGKDWPTENSVTSRLSARLDEEEASDEDREGCELYYYVSIRCPRISTRAILSDSGAQAYANKEKTTLTAEQQAARDARERPESRICHGTHASLQQRTRDWLLPIVLD